MDLVSVEIINNKAKNLKTLMDR